MKTNPYRNHSIAAALAATFVTTVLVSSLVELFGRPAAPDRRRSRLRDRHRPGSPPDDEPGRLELTHARCRCPAADGRAPFFQGEPDDPQLADPP